MYYGGLLKGDTRSLDYSSYGHSSFKRVLCSKGHVLRTRLTLTRCMGNKVS